MFTDAVGAEQVALTYRRMPPQTGGKGSHGHSHRTPEELYLVIAGTPQFELGDDVVNVGPLSCARVASATVRSIWDEGPDGVELAICSVRLADQEGEHEMHEGFWPA